MIGCSTEAVSWNTSVMMPMWTKSSAQRILDQRIDRQQHRLHRVVEQMAGADHEQDRQHGRTRRPRRTDADTAHRHGPTPSEHAFGPLPAPLPPRSSDFAATPPPSPAQGWSAWQAEAVERSSSEPPDPDPPVPRQPSRSVSGARQQQFDMSIRSPLPLGLPVNTPMLFNSPRNSGNPARYLLTISREKNLPI